MSNIVLPSFPGLDNAVHRIAMYASKVQSSLSMREVGISYTSYPVYEWELKFNALRDYATPAEAYQFLAFFHLMKGRGDYFLYTDPEISSSTDTNIGTGTGTQTQYRIGYLHTEALSGLTFLEPVQEATGVIIKVNGVTKVLTTDYTISSAGLVTFVVAPAAGTAITYTGVHKYRCRLTDDKINLSRVVSQIWASSLKFRSQKV